MTRTLLAVIDRIEGEFAVIEIEGTFVDWPLRALPEGVCEGMTWEVTWLHVPSSPEGREEPPRPTIIEL